MFFNLKIGFTQWTIPVIPIAIGTGKNLPKQIWGRKDRGLKRDARARKEEILDAASVFYSIVLCALLPAPLLKL